MVKKVIIIFLTVFCMAIISIHCVYAEDVPLGQGSETAATEETEGITSDVFGDKNRHFHPFLAVEIIHSKNLFYTDTNETSGYTTSISPGIWLAFPESRETLMSLKTSSASPGGVEYSHMQPDSSQRMQTYFLYSPSFVYYSSRSEFDHIDHKVEGLFTYNFGFDLSLEIFDQYNIKSDINDDSIGEQLDEYHDNVFTFVASYSPSPKFKFRFDYSNYLIKFDESINEYRDRKDNSVDFYVFFKFRPKTSFFIEYERTDIEYDYRTDYDSIEDRYYAGIDWEVSAKSKGRFKIGYLEKSFDISGNGDQEDFSMEAQAQHTFSPKTAMSLNAYQKYHETSMINSLFIKTQGISGAFLMRFTKKWSGALNASYGRDVYEGSDLNGTVSTREDILFGIGPVVKFDAKKWLVFEGGFHYNSRDSNYDIYDYENEIIYLRMKIAI